MREIKLCSSSNIDAIIEIEEERFDKSAYSYKTYADAISSTNSLIFGAFENEILCGFVLLTLSLDEAEIDHIAVKESFEGRGIGNELLNFSADYLKNKGFIRLFLEVRKSNIRAKNLYEKNGYKFYRIREKYYASGEDALCYKKEI